LALSDAARAVARYSWIVKEELKDKDARKVFSLGDIRLYECPVSYVSRGSVEIMRLVYLIGDSGNLLHSGGWGNQPMWLVEAVEIFNLERTRALKEIKDSNALTG
jgi:hypothetical protein